MTAWVTFVPFALIHVGAIKTSLLLSYLTESKKPFFEKKKNKKRLHKYVHIRTVIRNCTDILITNGKRLYLLRLGVFVRGVLLSFSFLQRAIIDKDRGIFAHGVI